MQNYDVSALFQRMKGVANVSEDQELAEVLGVTKGTFSNWRKKAETIRFINVFNFAINYQVDFYWLFTGIKKEQALSTHEKMALLAFNDLNERQKLNAIAYMTGLHQESGKQPAIVQTANGDSNNLIAEIKNK
ncbi:chromosome partitioning protein ParA [Gallibacterium anatis]|uniref:helix-turn-helix domain-containing protein n=1 Tax=Gallibacterium anatis TaxID=750 RepID=UPI000531FFC0|nr:helix-turn-helix domain-containing protein [Gallibacterium anatis]KGQ55826.1 chromosome partitioning protein ParA [Gallibacterium anatis]